MCVNDNIYNIFILWSTYVDNPNEKSKALGYIQKNIYTQIFGLWLKFCVRNANCL